MRVKACEICGKRAARYICQECGREVCQFCFEPSTWFCSDCYNHLKREAPALESFLWPAPFKLFLLGFFLIFVGTIFMMIATVLPGALTGVGAIVFVGPIPIILGAGPHLILAVILASALTILGIVMFIISRKRAG